MRRRTWRSRTALRWCSRPASGRKAARARRRRRSASSNSAATPRSSGCACFCSAVVLVQRNLRPQSWSEIPAADRGGTCCPPLGFEGDERELRAVNEAIRAAQPDLVFVALGVPKQECWMERHGRRSGVPVLIGVGGSFEIVGGVLRRAPRFFQRIGCEWLYRLLLEPRRLWKRYLIGNGRFLWIVLRQAVRTHSEQPDSSRHIALEARPRLASATAKE